MKVFDIRSFNQNMFPSIRFGEAYFHFQGRVTADTFASWGIVKQTEAKLRLRGVGSGYFEAMPSHVQRLQVLVSLAARS